MIDRINQIAQVICAEVNKIDSLPVQHIYHHLETLKEGEELSNTACLHYLLYVACCINLQQSVSDLLKLGIDSNIILNSFTPDWLCHLEDGIPDEPLFRPIPETTLLSLACQRGNLAMVKHLIENHSANANAQDNLGNTPLHYTVFSDSVRYENNPDQIAKYLLEHGANMFVKNKKGQTPYDAANQHAPNFCQRLFGYHNPAKYKYDGDKVRPIFEKVLQSQKSAAWLNKYF